MLAEGLASGSPFSPEIPGLLEKHLEHLKASAISIEVLRERGYCSVLGKSKLADLGFSPGQRRAPGILMPIWSPVGRNSNYQYRPDNPRTSRDGKPVKYETPGGKGLHLDVPPRCRSHIGDPGIDLWITEGIKKGDSLASRNICAVSMLGVWGFAGRNLQGGITTLSEWRDIALNRRQVFVAYDSDVVIKRQVQQALNILCDLLSRRGADVFVIYLPSADGTKVGIDDFLCIHSPEDALQLARRPEDGARLRGGYRVEKGCICRVKIEAGGAENVQPLCNFEAKVIEDITRDDGVDLQHYFVVEGQSAGGRSMPRIEVSAASFATLNWVVPNWGVSAVIAAGLNAKDSLREAIQLMSLGAGKRTVYCHTGWREIGGRWVFLSTGNEELDVELPGQLKQYRLPPIIDHPKEAIRASLRLLDVAPSTVTIPLLSAVYAAPLAEAVPSVLTLFLYGPTGNLKTSLACLAISHFGGPFSRASVPVTFESTENSIERLASQAKDVLLLVDDMFPQPTEAKARQQEQTAQRLIRGQAAHTGRSRLRSDASLRPSYVPRGFLVTTGEMLPTGQSTHARMLVVEVSRDQVDLGLLAGAQDEASLYPQAMRSYIDWLSPRMPALKQELPKELLRLRNAVQQGNAHLNIAEMVAQLLMGWDMFLQHAAEAGAIVEGRRDELLRLGFDALVDLGNRQQGRIALERPTGRFINILKDLFAQKRACLRDRRSNEAPAGCDVWGWERVYTEAGERPLSASGAEFLGWIDDELVYLLSEASYKAVVRFSREQGDPVTVGKRALHMQLHREGILIPADGQNIVLKSIAGSTHRVIQLDINAFTN